MIQRVLERCAMANRADSIVLCSDNQHLCNQAIEWGHKSILTSSKCESGSERISSVVEELASGESLSNCLIINVQGDQPFINPSSIDLMAEEFLKRKPTPEMLTPIYKMQSQNIHDPNVVKTLVTGNGRAIYFSRSAIPHVRGVNEKEWHKYTTYWGHVGIYGYRGDVLANWNNFPKSNLESIEKLEQLRLIEAGIEIGTFPVEGESLSVDTKAQLELARKIAESEYQDVQ